MLWRQLTQAPLFRDSARIKQGSFLWLFAQGLGKKGLVVKLPDRPALGIEEAAR